MVKQAYLDGYMAHHQDPSRWIMAGDFSWDFLWKNEWNIVEINRRLWVCLLGLTGSVSYYLVDGFNSMKEM